MRSYIATLERAIKEARTSAGWMDDVLARCPDADEHLVRSVIKMHESALEMMDHLFELELAREEAAIQADEVAD